MVTTSSYSVPTILYLIIGNPRTEAQYRLKRPKGMHHDTYMKLFCEHHQPRWSSLQNTGHAVPFGASRPPSWALTNTGYPQRTYYSRHPPPPLGASSSATVKETEARA